jgi:uncharacterized protein with HEPN domain
MLRRELALLDDIAEACRMIAHFVKDCDFDTFSDDPARFWASISQILVIGEAAKRLPETFRRAHPTIPWSEMARTRDKLIHHYEEIRKPEIWVVVTTDIPALLAYVVPLIPPDEE